MRGRWAALLAAATSLALAGCSSAGRCQDDLNCPSEQVCRDGECVDRLCLSSATCEMEQYCSEEEGRCVDGCQSDLDCYAYHRCDAQGQCVNAACVDTTLDCAFGQVCDAVSGECVDAEGAYCRPCAVSADCGGAHCADIGAPDGQLYCMPDCSESECPWGYECTPLYSGPIEVGAGCWAACWML